MVRNVRASGYHATVERKLKGGLFSALVLLLIGNAEDPIHGYYIIQSLSEWSDGILDIKPGTLYPILRTLEEQGLVTHRQVRSSSGPPKNLYEVTSEGKEAMGEVEMTLDRIFKAVNDVRFPQRRFGTE